MATQRTRIAPLSIYVKVSDRTLIRKIAAARGENVSGMVRTVMREEAGRLKEAARLQRAAEREATHAQRSP